jgi:hypothetical protein
MAFVVGLSPASMATTNRPFDKRNKHHMVVYKNGKPWYDPNYRRRRPMIKGRPHFMWIVTNVSRK